MAGWCLCAALRSGKPSSGSAGGRALLACVPAQLGSPAQQQRSRPVIDPHMQAAAVPGWTCSWATDTHAMPLQSHCSLIGMADALMCL